MIPKIIHYCWLSNDPYPESIQYCIDSWKKYLPDYELMLWNFDRFPRGKSKWVDEAFEAHKYAFAADYIRMYALYNYGGIYLDSDVEVVKSYNNLLHLPYFIGKESTPSGIEAATLGFEKGNQLIGNILKYYEGRSFYKKNGEFDITPLPYIIRKEIDDHFKYNSINDISEFDKNSQVVNIFPVDFFSPKSWDTKEVNFTENTYSIHHFEGSWLENNKKEEDIATSYNENFLLSVLIPVYNVEKYLDRCMQSITKQSYKNIEIILVDDGSTDRGSEMCDRWAQIDKRVKVIHQENKGLMMARKAAVEVANGDYQLFVDSDDWVERDLCKEIIDFLVKFHLEVDIIQFGAVMESQGKCSISERKLRDYYFNRYIYCKNTKELLTEAFCRQSFPWNLWGKVFRKGILQKAYSFLPNLRCTYAEDLFTSYLIYSISNNMIPIKTRMYHYNLGSGISTQNRSESSLFVNILNAYDTLKILRQISKQKELEFRSQFSVLDQLDCILYKDVIDNLARNEQNEISDKIDMWVEKVGASQIILQTVELRKKQLPKFDIFQDAVNESRIDILERDLKRINKKNIKHLKLLRIMGVVLAFIVVLNLIIMALSPQLVISISF